MSSESLRPNLHIIIRFVILIAMNELAKLMRARRLALGLSQEALAEKLNIDQTYVSKLETGINSYPVKNAGLLAQALQVRTEEVVMAILGPDGENPEAVTAAFKAVHERHRHTMSIRKPKASSSNSPVMRIPIFYEIAALGSEIKREGRVEVGQLEVLSTVVGGHTAAAFQTKGDNFIMPIEKGMKLLGLVKVTYPGNEVVVETKDQKIYWGALETVEKDRIGLILFDAKNTRQEVERANIWAQYRVESRHMPPDPAAA